MPPGVRPRSPRPRHTKNDFSLPVILGGDGVKDGGRSRVCPRRSHFDASLDNTSETPPLVLVTHYRLAPSLLLPYAFYYNRNRHLPPRRRLSSNGLTVGVKASLVSAALASSTIEIYGRVPAMYAKSRKLFWSLEKIPFLQTRHARTAVVPFLRTAARAKNILGTTTLGASKAKNKQTFSIISVVGFKCRLITLWGGFEEETRM